MLYKERTWSTKCTNSSVLSVTASLERNTFGTVPLSLEAGFTQVSTVLSDAEGVQQC